MWRSSLLGCSVLRQDFNYRTSGDTSGILGRISTRPHLDGRWPYWSEIAPLPITQLLELGRLPAPSSTLGRHGRTPRWRPAPVLGQRHFWFRGSASPRDDGTHRDFNGVGTRSLGSVELAVIRDGCIWKAQYFEHVNDNRRGYLAPAIRIGAASWVPVHDMSVHI